MAVMLAALRVKQAIQDKGVNPGFHDGVMGRHRQEWPVLWAALDELLATLDEI